MAQEGDPPAVVLVTCPPRRVAAAPTAMACPFRSSAPPARSSVVGADARLVPVPSSVTSSMSCVVTDAAAFVCRSTSPPKFAKLAAFVPGARP